MSIKVYRKGLSSLSVLSSLSYKGVGYKVFLYKISLKFEREYENLVITFKHEVRQGEKCVI